ncbi:MAG: hypothetical protein ACYCX5_12765 [Coriobacteriia bacterium]
MARTFGKARITNNQFVALLSILAIVFLVAVGYLLSSAHMDQTVKFWVGGAAVSFFLALFDIFKKVSMPDITKD